MLFFWKEQEKPKEEVKDYFDKGPQSSRPFDPEKDIYRIAVFYTNDKFIGYKADTYWSLCKDAYKRHPKEHIGLNDHLIDNLLYLENTTDKKIDLKLVVEEIDENGVLVRIVARYLIAKNEKEEFVAREIKEV